MSMRVREPSKLRSANRALMIVALVVLGFYFVVYVSYALNLMQFPFDYDQGEGFELVDTVMFSKGQWPYQNTETFPFYSSNYPPLFHVIAAPFVWIFGTAYWYGRLLGFVSTLITASVIGLGVYRRGGNRWAVVLSGLAFLASNTVYHIGPLFRQHMTMVMFETLAVVTLAAVNEIGNTRRRRRTMAAGLLLIIAAGYTKQLAAATALAVGLFLFLRQPRRAVIWGIFAVVVGAAIFVWMTIATNGEWWRQAILANVNELNILQTIGLFRQWFWLHGFLIVPAALMILYELYFDRLSIYSIWFVVTVVVNGMASGTWGGGDSYFGTTIAATCILSGIFVSRTLDAGWRFPRNYLSRFLIDPFRRYGPQAARVGLVVMPLLYIGYGRAVLHMPTNLPVYSQLAQVLNITPNALNGFYDSARTQDGQFPGGYASIGHFTTQTDIDAGWRIVDLIRRVEKPVISEDAAFSLMAGREVITNPTQLLNLEKKGLYNGSSLIHMIENQDFGMIVLRAQFYPVKVLQAVGRAYMIGNTVEMNGFQYIILYPNPDWTPPAG